MKNIEYKGYVSFSYLTIGVNIITGFILFPLIIDNIAIEALSVFGILFALKSIIDTFVSGFSSGIIKSLLKYHYLKSSIFTLSIVFYLFYGILSLGLLNIYSYFFYEKYFFSFFWFSLYVLITIMTNSFFELLISSHKQHIVAFLRFILQLLFLICSVVLFSFFEFNSIDYIFLGLLISSVVVFLMSLFFYGNFKEIKFSLKNINKKVLSQLFLKDGKIYFFHTLSITLLFNLDVILIDFFYGSESAGIYMILFKIPNTLIILGFRLSEPFRITVFNELNKNKKLLFKKFESLELKLLFLSFFVSILYFFFGKYFLEFWLGLNNVPNIKYMYIFPSVLIVLSVMQEFYSSVNFYTKSLIKVINFNFIQFLVKIIFIVYFFELFNEVTSLIGWSIISLLLIFFYRRNSLDILKG